MSDLRSPAGRAPRASAILILLGLLVPFFAVQTVAIYRENINWDEFGLLARTRDSIANQELFGGGRPGLATLVLVPFVRGCADVIDTVHAARWLWMGFAILYAVGFYLLARRFTDPESPSTPVLATALLILIPPVQAAMVQLRTDLPCLAASLWGANALLASRRRPLWALPGGAWIGIGFLFSQKAAYIGLLGGLLVLLDLRFHTRWEWKREALRLAWLVAGAAIALLAFRHLTPAELKPQVIVGVPHGLNAFAYYSKVVGYRMYLAGLKHAVPHLTLIALFAYALARGDGRRDRESAWTAATILVLGIAVGVFHRSAFLYFWMTLGIFAALALARALPLILNLFPNTVDRKMVLRLVWLGLVAWAAVNSTHLIEDGQRPQRESLRFVARNFSPADRGYHVEGGLTCWPDPSPLPFLVSLDISSRFHGPEAEANTRQMLAEFVSRPIRFIVYSHRLAEFPEPLQAFWRKNYVLYGPSVFVAGKTISIPAGQSFRFPIAIAGTYRWWPTDRARSPISIDGVEVGSEKTTTLASGFHEAHFSGQAGSGLLAIATPEPPAPGQLGFYRGGVLWP